MNTELTIKETQEAAFVVLKKLKEIFDWNNWKYYLAYGTLLGAIRHNGFIPWDDDIDIWVPRKDYELFIKYCIEHEQDLKPFELFHYKLKKNYVYTIGRFSDSRYKTDYENVKDYGLGVFVDIYPLDGMNPNDFHICKKINKVKREIAICGTIKIPRKNKIKYLLKLPYALVVKKKNLNKLLKLNDNLAQKYDFESCNNFCCMAWDSKQFPYKKEWLGNCTHIFNGELFRIPENYDEILKKLYGDYMKFPPKEERVGHHYYKVYKR